MANIPVTPHWDEIRRLAELGVPISKLAEDYNLNINTVWSQATKNDWLLPRKLKAKLDLEAAKSQSTSLLLGKGASETGALALLETWETRASDLRNLSYSVAVEAIKAAKGQIVIESASDLKHAVHVARQATGVLDTDAPQIQLSLFANQDISGPAIMESQVYEAETLQPVQEDADFWG
jgi:hypothetical protein